MKRILLSSLLGALAINLCTFIFWQIFCIQSKFTHNINNKEITSRALSNSINKSEGSKMVMLPSMPKEKSSKENQEEFLKKWEDGPYFYGVLRSGSVKFNIKKTFGLYFLTCFIQALLISILVSFMSDKYNYLNRVIFITLIGSLVALSSSLPNAIWMEYPMDYTLYNIGITLVTFFVSSIVISAVMKNRTV